MDRIFKFIYVTLISGFVCFYIYAITFYEVNESQKRFIDMSLSFLLGTVLTAAINFLFKKNDKDDDK